MNKVISHHISSHVTLWIYNFHVQVKLQVIFFSVKSRLKVHLSFNNTRVNNTEFESLYASSHKNNYFIEGSQAGIHQNSDMSRLEVTMTPVHISAKMFSWVKKNIPFSFVSRSSHIPKLLVFIFSLRYMTFSAFPPHQLFECRVTQSLCVVGLPSSVFIPV